MNLCPKKLYYARKSTAKVDITKVFVHIAWEMNLLELKQYIRFSEKLDAIGKMIGGWHGQVVIQSEKQNSSGTKPKEK